MAINLRDDAQQIYDDFEAEVNGLMAEARLRTECTPNDLINYQTAIMVATEKRLLACELRKIQALDELICEFKELKLKITGGYGY